MGIGEGDHRTNGVFISYRRGETSGQARALHDRLIQRFGIDRVFMDVDSIDPGSDFVEKIEQAIGSSAVVLVLIGRDWASRRRGKRLFDDPADFVRMETESALRSGVPVVPILIERARMPEPKDLPESLRPITRRSALELENQRWEYDVNRLVQVVEHLVDAAGKHTDRGQIQGGEEGASHKGRSSRLGLSRRVIFLAGTAVVAAGVAVLLLLFIPSGPQPVSAIAAVAAVAPDQLATGLLEHRLEAGNLPGRVEASAPYLYAYRSHGLVTSIIDPLSGPPSDLYVDYEIFDDLADASHYYSTSSPVDDGFKPTGNYSAKGIADRARCVTATSSVFGEWEWSCMTLSGTVVSIAVVDDDSDDASRDRSVEQQLTVGAVIHLASVASATPRGPAPPPPGHNGAGWLFNLLQSPSSLNDLLPYGLQTEPKVQRFPAGPDDVPKGLFTDSYVFVTLSGSEGDRGDYVTYYVFSSSRDASALYSKGVAFVGSTPTGTSFESSGFTQPIRCGTLDTTVGTTGPSVMAACTVDWGDVVIETASWPAKTATNPLTYNEDEAVTLARMAIMELDSLDAR